MAVEKYTALANLTLTSTASSVTFGSIPSGYRDLRVVMNWAGSAAANYTFVQFNGDTGNNYNYVLAYGGPTTSYGSVTESNISRLNVGVTRTALSASIFEVMDYAASDKQKTVLLRYGISDASEIAMQAGRWASTSPITSLNLFAIYAGNPQTFSIGSTFELYGVA